MIMLRVLIQTHLLILSQKKGASTMSTMSWVIYILIALAAILGSIAVYISITNKKIGQVPALLGVF